MRTGEFGTRISREGGRNDREGEGEGKLGHIEQAFVHSSRCISEKSCLLRKR